MGHVNILNAGGKKPYPLPNFIHFGTPKSGSATISDLLALHPQIYAPRPKELNFFNVSTEYEKGLHWYCNTYFADHTAEPILCDNSIGYSAGNPKLTMSRMTDALGHDFKILMTLRHPVKRAYSQYCMARYKGQFESADFVEAIQSALDVHGRYSADELRWALDEQAYYRDTRAMAIYRDAMYIVPGEHSRLLELCQKAVGSDNVLVLFTEDMGEDLAGTVRKLTDFLGVDPINVDPGFRRNEATALRYPWLRRVYNRLYALTPVQHVYKRLGSSARRTLRKALMSWNYTKNLKVAPASPKAQNLLQEHYAADIRSLQELIGRDLSHWLQCYSEARSE